MSTSRIIKSTPSTNIFTKLHNTGVPLQAITQFFSDTELSSLVVDKKFNQDISQDPRWRKRLQAPLAATLHTQLTLESIRHPEKSSKLSTEQEEKIVNQVIVDLKAKGISQFRTLYARYRKFENKFTNDIFPDYLLLLSGDFSAIHAYLIKHKDELLQADPNNKKYIAIIKAIAFSGNTDAIRLMHKMGINLHVVDLDGVRIQHWLAGSGNPEAIKLCVELNLNRWAVTDHRRGMQHSAALSGNSHAIKACEALGLDMTASDSEGFGVAHYAAMSGCANAIWLCHKMGLDMQQRALNGESVQHMAALKGSVEALLVCRDIGLDMKALIYSTGQGLQHSAARSGNLSALLVCRNEFKLDMALLTTKGLAVQHYAALSGSREMLLGCRDIQLDMKQPVIDEKHGESIGVQHFAASSGKREAILACHDLNLDMKSIRFVSWNRTPISVPDMAAISGKREGLLACKTLGLEMNLIDEDLEAPIPSLALLTAFRSDSLEGFLTCHELALDQNLKIAKQAQLSLALATSGSEELIKVAKDLKLIPKEANADGNTFAHAAALSGRSEAIQACYEMGLDMKSTAQNIGIQHAAARKGDFKSLIKCDEIGLDMKSISNHSGLQHYAAMTSNSETLLVCWASGLNMKAKTGGSNLSIVEVATRLYGIGEISLSMAIKKALFCSVATLVQTYDHDYRYKLEYYASWSATSHKGYTEQVVNLLDQYLVSKTFGIFKPRYVGDAALMMTDLMANEKHATAESVFLYLAKQILLMNEQVKFSKHDNLIERIMFCMKMLYPLMLAEKRMHNYSRETAMLMDVYQDMKAQNILSVGVADKQVSVKTHGLFSTVSDPRLLVLSYLEPEQAVKLAEAKIVEQENDVGVANKFKLS
jgi:hypothetical protein